jgi:amino acid transporter
VNTRIAFPNFTGNLIDYLLFRFGLIGAFIIALIALSDGTLGGMTYILADSRTLKAMAEDRIMPSGLSKVKYSELHVGLVIITALTAMSYTFELYNTFTILGALASLNNLFVHIFVHISANSSLIRIASKRALKHLHEIFIGIFCSTGQYISLSILFADV